jgi:hypothetical protein
MFEKLVTYDKILVTGPQRSGTTICAKMIAVDTGHAFLSEAHVASESIEGMLCNLGRLMETRHSFVLQCPAPSRWIHEHSAEDVLVIFMRRAIRDIVASERRVGWGDSMQRAIYEEALAGHKFPATIAEAKYLFWEDVQRLTVHHWLEVEFESLAGHPLWVPVEQRVNFGIRQISIDRRFADEISGG